MEVTFTIVKETPFIVAVVCPLTKLLPEIVTELPPVTDPVEGEIPEIVGPDVATAKRTIPFAPAPPVAALVEVVEPSPPVPPIPARIPVAPATGVAVPPALPLPPKPPVPYSTLLPVIEDVVPLPPA